MRQRVLASLRGAERPEAKESWVAHGAQTLRWKSSQKHLRRERGRRRRRRRSKKREDKDTVEAWPQ
jgi:hypothetical protein